MLWGVLTLAIVARTMWAALVPVVPVSDSVMYASYARHLVEHNFYSIDLQTPSAFWPIGTSFIYSVLFRTFGSHYAPIVALNVLLGVCITAMTWVLARRWFGPRVAIIAALLVGLWPSQIEFTTVLASELPFIACMLAALLSWTSPRGGWRAAALTGLFIAAAAYVRPLALALPFVFVVLRVAHERRLWPALRAAVVAVAVAAACIAPWAARNHAAFGKWVLISTNGGTNTWMGNNPDTNGAYMQEPQFPGFNEAEKDAKLGEIAATYIRTHPGAFVKRSAVKLVHLHDRESVGVTWNLPGLRQRLPDSAISAIKLASNLYWWAALGLAIAGAITTVLIAGLRHRSLSVLFNPAAVLWGYFAFTHAVTVTQDRYHFPSIPFIAMLAATTLSFVSYWRSNRDLAPSI